MAGRAARRALLRLWARAHGAAAAFIEAVAPRTAVVPAGYRNRFGHPAKDVVQRYEDAGVEMLRTDRHGAVTVSLNAAGIAVRGERASRGRYWLQ